MRIVLVSHAFFPQVGGIETVSKILAEEWTKKGHEVIVITSTDGPKIIDTYQVLRKPTIKEFWRWVKWCDLIFHNNISLNYLWPLMFLRRPWLVVHHLWIRRVNGTTGWQDRLKRYVLRFAKNGANSLAIAQSLPGSIRVVGNPYDSEVFFFKGDDERKKDFIFAGRLVSDKGVYLLIEAFALLLELGYQTNLTLIGKGPEECGILQRIAQLGLENHIHIRGEIRGEELANAFHEHQCLVVPSLWEEPFGLVVVEGLACGCIVIAADGGGMREAGGEESLYFLRGESLSLAKKMETVLNKTIDIDLKRKKAMHHIRQFEREQVAKRYLELMK